MRKAIQFCSACLALVCSALAADPAVATSRYHRGAITLTANPEAPHWRSAPLVVMEKGPRGEEAPNHRTEVRSLWTDTDLYLLYTCPYEQLYLKPQPTMTEETNKLWDWDVAEVFLGSDFQNIRHYQEFQVSPQGEWVDLDINRDTPLPEGGWLWNSGFKVKARIDEAKKVWYGEMRIPFASFGVSKPANGTEIRANFYRLQGPAPRRMLAWQPTGQGTYHVPEKFGLLRLAR